MRLFGMPTFEDFAEKSSEELRRIKTDHKIGLAGARESLKYLPPSSFLGHWGARAAIKVFERELGWIDSILSSRYAEEEEKLTAANYERALDKMME